MDDLPPLPEKAVDAALHEFDALRSLMAIRFQMLTGLLVAALTATGVIAGLALDQHGNRHLLLLIPSLASCVAIIHTEQRRRINLQGRYIRDCLWPYLQKRVDAGLPSWEAYFEEKAGLLFIAYGDSQALGLLLLISAVALAAGSNVGANAGYELLFAVGVFLTVAAAAFAVLSATHQDSDTRVGRLVRCLIKRRRSPATGVDDEP
jgi:hypothetical protein